MGIFAAQGQGLYTIYQARIRIQDRILGGIPNNPKMIEGWLFAKGARDEADRLQFALRTLRELGYEPPADISLDAAMEWMENLADLQTNVFKRDEAGLYIESRYIDAMLKEGVNIVFSDRRFGLGRSLVSGEKKGQEATKNFMSAWKERVAVTPLRIHMKCDGAPVSEADGVETRVGHITDNRTGEQRAIIARNEYVEQPELTFNVQIMKDFLSVDDWAKLWLHCELHGLGATRSQDYGRFDVLAWDQVGEGSDSIPIRQVGEMSNRPVLQTRSA